MICTLLSIGCLVGSIKLRMMSQATLKRSFERKDPEHPGKMLEAEPDVRTEGWMWLVGSGAVGVLSAVLMWLRGDNWVIFIILTVLVCQYTTIDEYREAVKEAQKKPAPS